MRRVIQFTLLIILTIFLAISCDSVTSDITNDKALQSANSNLTSKVVTEGSVSIVSPEEGETVNGTVEFNAMFEGDLEDQLYWSVRSSLDGTYEGAEICESGNPNNLYGNTSVNSENPTPSTLNDGAFSASIDMSEDTPGTYCFVFNPDAGDVTRASVLFELVAPLENKGQCKKGGWQDYGFKNQGQCIRFVNTGKDSR